MIVVFAPLGPNVGLIADYPYCYHPQAFAARAESRNYESFGNALNLVLFSLTKSIESDFNFAALDLVVIQMLRK
ncbi:MAG: hypothetical protein KDD53_09205 [Bdellovibrionales bacterium]|nr:hypothetical protein [Bdellovibrionales bacterium]